MTAPNRRHARAARLAPLVLYAIIVAGWTVEALRIGATDLLPLILWTVPAAIAYLAGMRR